MWTRFDPFQDVWGPGRRPSMPLDAYRHGDEVVVHVDLPGVDPESIEITVDKNVLSVRAERSWTPAEGDRVLTSERVQGRFTRKLFLSNVVDGEHIEASYDRGVLTLTLPIAEQAKSRRVLVTTGAPAAAVTETTEVAESPSA
jgi:HSP20 family protein